MKNKMNSNLKTSTTEELSPIAEPAAASTPEGIADTSLTSLRRSLRIKQPKIPCACCTTGMHVRCYTNVEGRRPIHSPRAVRRSLKRTPRVNATAAVERFSSARNNAGLKRNLDYIKRRRPLFKGGSERKVEETGEISVPDSDLILEAPSPPKRARLPNSSSGTEISTQIAVATLGPDLRKVPVTVGISVEFNVTVGTQAVEPLTQANLSIPNSEVQLMPAPAFEDNDLPEINESSAPISAAMKQENQDSQATGNTSDMEISNGQCSIPFIKIKDEPEESQVQSGGNGIVNSTMMTSFNDGSANEYYRQHSTSDEEGDTTPMLVRVKQEAEEEGEKPQRCGVM